MAREYEDIELRAPPDRLPHAEGEPDVVRRALAPLVDNARRHAEARVWFELDASEGRVHLAVRDDGPGLDSDIGEHAFEPGVRGPGSGAGLGLALARRLARSCGGDVRAGNGAGGCFVLELPALGVSEPTSGVSDGVSRSRAPSVSGGDVGGVRSDCLRVGGQVERQRGVRGGVGKRESGAFGLGQRASEGEPEAVSVGVWR